MEIGDWGLGSSPRRREGAKGKEMGDWGFQIYLNELVGFRFDGFHVRGGVALRMEIFS
jgi:hypothetical protein